MRRRQTGKFSKETWCAKKREAACLATTTEAHVVVVTVLAERVGSGNGRLIPERGVLCRDSGGLIHNPTLFETQVTYSVVQFVPIHRKTSRST
jgi:hypothetical protein